MLGLVKVGRGLYAGSLHFRVTTINDRGTPRGCVLFLAVWWAKLEKNKVRHNMTQIPSLLAVATDLWTPFYSRGGGGRAYTRDKTTYAGT